MKKNKKIVVSSVEQESIELCEYCKGKGCHRCDCTGTYNDKRYIYTVGNIAIDADTLK